MNETPLLSCIFGCADQEDNLKHYVSCPCLWTLAASACGLPLASLPSSPFERLCIINRTSFSFKLLGVVFRGYHAMKLGQRSLVDDCLASGVFEPVLLKYLEICIELHRHH